MVAVYKQVIFHTTHTHTHRCVSTCTHTDTHTHVKVSFELSMIPPGIAPFLEPWFCLTLCAVAVAETCDCCVLHCSQYSLTYLCLPACTWPLDCTSAHTRTHTHAHTHTHISAFVCTLLSKVHAACQCVLWAALCCFAVCPVPPLPVHTMGIGRLCVAPVCSFQELYECRVDEIIISIHACVLTMFFAAHEG